jgi:hypothetical protein
MCIGSLIMKESKQVYTSDSSEWLQNLASDCHSSFLIGKIEIDLVSGS